MSGDGCQHLVAAAHGSLLIKWPLPWISYGESVFCLQQGFPALINSQHTLGHSRLYEGPPPTTYNQSQPSITTHIPSGCAHTLLCVQRLIKVLLLLEGTHTIFIILITVYCSYLFIFRPLHLILALCPQYLANTFNQGCWVINESICSMPSTVAGFAKVFQGVAGPREYK